MLDIQLYEKNYPWQAVGGSMFVGVLRSAIMSPIERGCLVMQHQPIMLKLGKHPQKYDGILSCYKKIIKEEGYKGLFRGFSIQGSTNYNYLAQ
jgi:hypothetical protein